MSFVTDAPLLPEILSLHGKWRGPDPAVVADGQRWSWAQFTGEAHRFAHGLRAHNVQEGDRVGLLMSNGFPMVQALFGAIAGGAVVVPLNTSVSDDALLGMLMDAGVSAVVASDDLQSRLATIASALPDPLLRVSPSGAGSDTGTDRWIDFQSLCAGQPDTLPELGLTPESLINIIYSSGTTGTPKGIAHDHRGRRDWAYDVAIALRYHGGARTLLTIGLYSNISWVAMLSTLLAGGCIFVHSRFNEQAFIDSVRRDRITHTAMVPIQFQRVLEAAEQQSDADFSSMQAMMSCGSPLRETLKKRIFDHFACGIIELYGLTEGIITTLETEHAEGRWASVGRPLIGTDIAIVGDNDEQLPVGEAGEIVSRGRIAMPGYWRREDADQEAMWTDSTGRVWMRSGDVGYVDAEGFLYIVDRKKDMILSGGQNIYPQDIEALLVTHSDVFDVAVIGLPSDKWGETPVGLVVFRDETRTDPEGLLTWINQRVGRQQRLAEIIEVTELPRNPNGKILKRELRAQYKDRRYG